jgi:hypothetical protein
MDQEFLLAMLSVCVLVNTFAISRLRADIAALAGRSLNPEARLDETLGALERGRGPK